ncbi:MAG TPA: TonB-dependent receptor [Thermoanaerobaculia bacterium]|nr:TonB-dependent receptor [Thermoanaerobaculia bacterium]
MRRNFTMVLLALLVGGIAASAHAQSTTATIRGKVTNQSGAGVADAEISAVGVTTGFVRTVKTGPDGSFTLAGISPGEINLVVAAPGFDPISQIVTVLVGQSLEVNPQLSPTSTLRESITVVGTQAVETETSEIATNVTTHQIENLPQDDRNFLNFAALAPGIRLSKDPLRKTFAGDAQDPEQTNIYIDGVSTKNDILQGGTSGQDSSRGNPFPQSAVQEFRVITQNYGAQYGQASSAIITAVTKSGGNDFKGQAFVYYQPNSWVEETEKNFQFSTLTTNSEYRRLQPGISLGGPIIKDRLHFFVTYEGDDEDAQKPVVITIPQFASQFSQYTGTFDAPFRSHLFFGKMSWQISPAQIAEFSSSYRDESETRDFGDQNSFESATDYKNYVYGATARHQWINGSALNEATVSLQRFGWNPSPRNPDLVGRRYFAPGFATVIRIGGGSTTQEFDQRRLELRDNYHLAPMKMYGTHNLQVGGNIDFMKYKVNKSLNGNPEFKFLPNENGVYGDIPFEADFGIGDPRLSLDNREYGIYAQDKWLVNDKLSLDLGLRWDYESKMLDDEYVTPANIVAALKGKTFSFDGRTISIPDEYFSTGNEREPYKNMWQPRFGFTYDLRGDSKSVVFGGWGKYYDRLFLNSTLDERFRLQFPVYRFRFSPDGSGGTVAWNPSYFTKAGLQALIASGAARPEIYLLSNETKPPYSTQYNVGFRQSFGSWLGSISYNAVRAKRGITYVAASGTCCGAFAPGFGNVILNDPIGKEFWYDGISLTLDRPYTGSNRWGARFTYTHATAEQTGNDLFSLDLPAANLYARHPRAGSEPNRFNATAIVGLPWDIRFSANIVISTGEATPVFDFSKGFSLAGRLETGVINDAVYPDGGYRTADFRLAKDFPAFAGTTIGLVAEVFNAFNETNFGCLSSFVPPEGNPNLGTPGCVVSLGRREQIGLKVSF